MITKSLGEMLREWRDKADISLRELARDVGVSAPFLSDVELGKRYPRDDVLRKIAERLEIAFDDLKRYDNRESVADIKRMMQADPKIGFAFRTAAEKIKDGSLTAEGLVKKLEQKGR